MVHPPSLLNPRPSGVTLFFTASYSPYLALLSTHPTPHTPLPYIPGILDGCSGLPRGQVLRGLIGQEHREVEPLEDAGTLLLGHCPVDAAVVGQAVQASQELEGRGNGGGVGSRE